MTTNPGSLMPVSRETRVAAGIPIAVAMMASAMAAKVWEGAGIHRQRIHQSRTVARDAHVPGPGFRRPMPKNVATTQAQVPAGERDSPAAADEVPSRF